MPGPPPPESNGRPLTCHFFFIYQNILIRVIWSGREICPLLMDPSKVFAYGDVTPLIGPPYLITAHGLYPILTCNLAKFRN